MMSDILFDNITIWSSNGGMKIQGRGGGSTPVDIVNVTWSNIIIETECKFTRDLSFACDFWVYFDRQLVVADHAPRWWGNGDWLGITLLP